MYYIYSSTHGPQFFLNLWESILDISVNKLLQNIFSLGVYLNKVLSEMAFVVYPSFKERILQEFTMFGCNLKVICRFHCLIFLLKLLNAHISGMFCPVL